MKLEYDWPPNIEHPINKKKLRLMRGVYGRLSTERRVHSPISVGPHGAGEPTEQPNLSFISSVVRQLPLGYPFLLFFVLFWQPSLFRHFSLPEAYARVIKQLKYQILPPNIRKTSPSQTILQTLARMSCVLPQVPHRIAAAASAKFPRSGSPPATLIGGAPCCISK